MIIETRRGSIIVDIMNYKIASPTYNLAEVELLYHNNAEEA